VGRRAGVCARWAGARRIETFVGELARRGVAIERVRPTDGMALVAAYSLLLSAFWSFCLLLSAFCLLPS
jgi:hypothetical protein